MSLWTLKEVLVVQHQVQSALHVRIPKIFIFLFIFRVIGGMGSFTSVLFRTNPKDWGRRSIASSWHTAEGFSQLTLSLQQDLEEMGSHSAAGRRQLWTKVRKSKIGGFGQVGRFAVNCWGWTGDLRSKMTALETVGSYLKSEEWVCLSNWLLSVREDVCDALCTALFLV